jgi:hypothetical protein
MSDIVHREVSTLQPVTDAHDRLVRTSNVPSREQSATSDSGDVQISTARCVVKIATEGLPPPGLYVQVRVKDSGQGMPAETVRKIFDSFFTTKGENGSGLRLPQVCAFMRQIGGHVGVTIEPGIGTTFDLLFPADQPDDIAEVHHGAKTTIQSEHDTSTGGSKLVLQRQSEMRSSRAADAYGEMAETMPDDNNLWRQIDRWVNEGGAIGARTAPLAKV